MWNSEIDGLVCRCTDTEAIEGYCQIHINVV